MAELLAAGAGLGIASSLITFAEVGWKVVRRIKEYNDRTDDVPEVLKHINAQLPVLLNKVAEIQRQIDGKSQQCIRSESALAVAVTSCEEQIKRLDVLTGKMLPSGSDSKTRRAKKVVYSIYYEKELNKTWAEMETYKTTLVLHFTPTTEVTARMEALELQRSVFSVPFERDLKFISRGDVMTQIESTLRDHHRVAIAGIGGIGYCYSPVDGSQAQLMKLQEISDRHRILLPVL
jgi:DNA-binding protein H-NS